MKTKKTHFFLVEFLRPSSIENNRTSKTGTAGDREAIMERFSDLLDRRRDRSRLDFFFSAAAKKGEEKEGEEEECEVKAEARLTKAAAKKSNGGGGGDDDEGIQVKEERGSDCEDDDDDSWGPPRGGDDWALDGDEEREEAKEEAKEAWAASPPPAPPPPPPPPPPQAPFDLSSVDESEQRRIMAEIQVVVSAERLLRDLQQGGKEARTAGRGEDSRRWPRLPPRARKTNEKTMGKKRNLRFMLVTLINCKNAASQLQVP